MGKDVSMAVLHLGSVAAHPGRCARRRSGRVIQPVGAERGEEHKPCGVQRHFFKVATCALIDKYEP